MIRSFEKCEIFNLLMLFINITEIITPEKIMNVMKRKIKILL